MSHTDKVGETLSGDQIDVDHVLNDIRFDRPPFTKQQIDSSAASSKEMEKKGILPDCTIG